MYCKSLKSRDFIVTHHNQYLIDQLRLAEIGKVSPCLLNYIRPSMATTALSKYFPNAACLCFNVNSYKLRRLEFLSVPL